MTAERGARLLLLGRDFDLRDDVRLRPRGAFQRENFAVAVAAAEAYAGGLDAAAVRAAAESVRRPGRMEVVGDGAAHDPRRRAQPGRVRRACSPELDALVGERPLVAVLSVLDDKDAAGMLAALAPRCARAVFTRSSNRGALPPAVLESLWRQVGGPERARSWPSRSRRSSVRAARRAPDGAVLVDRLDLPAVRPGARRGDRRDGAMTQHVRMLGLVAAVVVAVVILVFFALGYGLGRLLL